MGEAASILEYDPQNYPIPALFIENLAKAYEKQDDVSSAIKYFEQALELNPGSHPIREKLLSLGADPETLELTLSATELEQYAATYRIENLFDIDIRLEDGQLFSSAPKSAQPKGQMLLVPECRL